MAKRASPNRDRARAEKGGERDAEARDAAYRRATDGAALMPARDASGAKMAEKLAYTLEAEIMAMGWPIGQPVGSEPELIERFGVSRAVFREAVRIVEHHGVARMRRGPGGGLIATAPDPNAVVRPVTLYLDYANVSAQDLFDVRSALELTCARITAETIDEDGIARLRGVLERERELGAAGVLQGHPHELHVAIAEITGNAAMKMFVEILTRLTYERTVHLAFEASELEAVHHAHTSIVEAIVAGDSGLAQHRMTRHLAASTLYYRQRTEKQPS